jgi:hypothetical protein
MNRGGLKSALLIGCLVFSLLLIAVLYILSDKLNHKKNGFIRIIPPDRIMPMKTRDIKYADYYIAGITSHHIYLGNIQAPGHLLVTDYTLRDTQHLQLYSSDTSKFAWNAVKVLIDSPDIYMTEGITPSILKGSMPSFNISRCRIDSIRFSISVPISEESFVFRTYSPRLKQQILIKKTFDSPHFKIILFELEKQSDGIFSTDGMLLYEHNQAYLIYVYFYRNLFVCLDTNLNQVYKGKTIDTISIAKIKIENIKSENEQTFSSPPLLVNKKSCVNGKWFFVNSKLKANNENKELFNHSSVIDIYSTKNGQYNFSFYLPDYNGKKLNDFRVYDNTLIALFDQYIRIFKLNF